ncbi:Piso0_005565 [Millerozyma farinosa CBS 7064]|uniref:Piso0_005565 protein n=1 Tax=Pichia sorbitophila (strain ATCC MYA-4447 / BCRC 22081 / CBS 7064 / NBRC 10061 / NRRL Y-12695) TaxID=559304 RepID=G8Y2B4_PICSO|nr:Piso0_005565 [Millerozyma farinosa CBS 7064]
MEEGMEEDALNTPISRIKNLRITSPEDIPVEGGCTSGSGLDVVQDRSILQAMIEKGYSQKITNNVLQELNARANDIASQLKSPSTKDVMLQRRRKRFSGIHRAGFNKMESISNHYSVKGAHEQKDPMTVTKKRRTLTGIELSSSPVKSPPRSSPRDNNMSSSPNKELDSSPTRRISPSKKSFNLNGLLKGPSDRTDLSFNSTNISRPNINSSPKIKSDVCPRLSPPTSSEVRLTKSPPNKSLASQKTACPNTERTRSVEPSSNRDGHYASSGSATTSTVNNTSSMRHHTKTNNVGSNSHMSTSSKSSRQKAEASSENWAKPFAKPTSIRMNIPSVRQASSSGTQRGTREDLRSRHDNTQSFQLRKSATQERLTKTSSQSSIPRQSSMNSMSSSRSLNDNKKPNYTIPKPFSLYNKPTISSSQKAISRSQRSLSSLSKINDNN